MNQKISRREERRLHQQGLGRTQLLDAAEEVFGRKGYHEATLKEVAELAEFSVGSVYSFFESKDDLFRQLFARRGAEFMAGMRAVLADDAAPLDQLRRLVEFQVGFFRSHPDFARLVLRYANVASLATADAGVDVAANHAEAMELQAALFERGQRAGVVRDGDPHVLASLLSGIVFAFQAVDPVVAGAAGADADGFPLAALTDVVHAAFAAR